MPESLWMTISFLASFAGMGWFALAMDPHWQQVHGSGTPSQTTRRLLRVMGSVALAASLAASFLADHPSMAPLVWIMGLAAAALANALLLTWRPRVLRLLYKG